MEELKARGYGAHMSEVGYVIRQRQCPHGDELPDRGRARSSYLAALRASLRS